MEDRTICILNDLLQSVEIKHPEKDLLFICGAVETVLQSAPRSLVQKIFKQEGGRKDEEKRC